MFWIRIVVWIKYPCAHILDTGLRIPVDLHFEGQRFISKLVVYLFTYLFIFLDAFTAFICLFV